MILSHNNIKMGIWVSFVLYMSLVLSIYGIGTGGILNLVPQAVVKINHKILTDCKVYVHPLEGSLLVVFDKNDVCIALDKNKNQTVKVDKKKIIFLNDGTKVDVPHDTLFEILSQRPHFYRLKAVVFLEKSKVLEISVPR